MLYLNFQFPVIEVNFTGGDNSNKACFGRKTNFFPGIWRFCRESGDSGIFPKNMTYFRDIFREV